MLCLTQKLDKLAHYIVWLVMAPFCVKSVDTNSAMLKDSLSFLFLYSSVCCVVSAIHLDNAPLKSPFSFAAY